MSPKIRKMVSAVALTAVVAGMVSGCGSSQATSSPAASAAATATAKAVREPFKITGLNQTFGDAPAVDNRLVKEIETYTNTKLDITWAPAASYNDKFTTVIAAGEMPMFMLVTDDKASAYLSALKQGAFWEVGAYLKDYPALSALSKAEWDNAKYEGKNYLVPRWRPIARNGLIYRKDWADAAGLKDPTNIDELYTMIKTFATGDFDKNGKVDSVGFALDSGFGKYQSDSVSYITSVFGASTNWGVDASGKVIPNYAEKEYLEALKWLRKLYSEKLINQDFAVLQNSRQMFAKGNTGVYGNTCDDIRASENVKDLPANAASAKLAVAYNLTGPKGVRSAASGSGYYGGFVIPKSTVKNEADFKKVLSFLNSMADEKIVNLLNYGVDGVDFKSENGVAVQTAEQKAKYVTDLGPLGQLNCGDSSKLLKPQSPLDVEVYKMWDSLAKNVVLDPTAALVSPTWASKNADLLKLIQDAKVKFVMGVIDENGYNDAIKKWYAAGGDKVCEEYTTALNASKK